MAAKSSESPGDNKVIVHNNSKKGVHADRQYLNIPAQNALPDDAIKLWVDGKMVEISFEGWSHMEDPLSDLSVDNHIKGIDNLYAEKYRP